ncbi:MAG: hypothetical protein AB1481_07815 [Candidatus Omnitrophota bacterium]
MYMPRIYGLFAVIPASVFLAICFFVLVVSQKAETKLLKALGKITAVSLLIAACLFISSGVYMLATGRQPMMCMMPEMMKWKMYKSPYQPMPGMMKERRQKMMQENMPAMPAEPDEK